MLGAGKTRDEGASDRIATSVLRLRPASFQGVASRRRNSVSAGTISNLADASLEAFAGRRLEDALRKVRAEGMSQSRAVLGAGDGCRRCLELA